MSEDKVEYQTRTIKVLIGVKGKPLYDEMGYMIEITDECGGEFIELSASRESGKIRIDSESWPALRDAIEDMIEECREDA